MVTPILQLSQLALLAVTQVMQRSPLAVLPEAAPKWSLVKVKSMGNIQKAVPHPAVQGRERPPHGRVPTEQ